MIPTGFTNSFTSGEIFPDAQDRVDIQPLVKGCEQATNMMVQVVGPLKKRRGLWSLGGVPDQTKLARLVRFARSIDDALMLLFGDLTVTVFNNDGSPLLNGGVQVSFASPYTESQLAGLRYNQVADVIYFTHSAGVPVQALARITNTSWSFSPMTYPDGPWLAENIDTAFTLTFTGTDVVDANTGIAPPKSATIEAGQAVTIAASKPLFTADMVGDTFRIRVTTGSASVHSWTPGFHISPGNFGLSVGNIYICTAGPGSYGADTAVTTPPVQTIGLQSDGVSTWKFLHDGAGVVQITAVADAMNASGTVLSNIPVGSGSDYATSYWSLGAYGTHNGWPRAWPSVVEERLATAACANSLDMIDLTRTAGFYPTSLDYHPGQGTGAVIDTDAVRRRLGNSGGEIIWTRLQTFLLVGTTDGEFVVSGGLFGAPITPSAVTCRQVSNFGSENVYPALGMHGIYFVARGGQTLRKLQVDMQQTVQGEDLSYLAAHIADRGMVQLAYLPQPDYALWVRLADGGAATFTIHEEQAVRGWTSQAVGGGFLLEDIVTLPGPSRLETLWAIFSRVKDGQTQRIIAMQSEVSDANFIDFSQLYQGAPVTVIGGLGFMAGETARIIADGGQLPDQVVSEGGTVTLQIPASRVIVGFAMPVQFVSLKLDVAQLGGTLLARQRVAGAVVDLLVADCQVGMLGAPAALMETFSSRTNLNVPATVSQKAIKKVSMADNTRRDPRILITEDSAFDFGIFSIKPEIVTSPVGAQG